MPGTLSKPKHDNGYVYIPISKTACKAAVGKYNVYDYEWLLDHLEQEYIILAGAKKLRDAKRAESIDKDWED